MPSSAEGYAVDTSVAVPALDAGHAAHGACADAVRSLRPALAGHAAFETFSVLTRMPGGLAIDAPTATALLARVFPDIAWLTGRHAVDLLRRLGPLGVVGGGVYDALVAEAARRRDLILLTRDRRAGPTYDLVGVRQRFVGT